MPNADLYVGKRNKKKNERYISEAAYVEAVRKKHGSKIAGQSSDRPLTFKQSFKQFGEFLRKVTERSRDSGRRSRDRRPTVKLRFLEVSCNLEKI